MKKMVIFDLDGTLYDNSRLPLLMILHSVGNLRLLKAERSARALLAGQYFPQGSLQPLLGKISAITGYDIEKVSTWYHEELLPLQKKLLAKYFHPKQSMINAIADLKSKGIMTACFSDYQQIEGKLQALGIDPALFDILADAPSMGGGKPCAEAFLKLASIAGVSPSECLVIGDRDDTDGEGARRSGMDYLIIPKKNIKQIDIYGQFFS